MSQSRPTDHEATVYAEHYVLYGDQSRAFRAAFPNCKAKAESVHQRASKLHQLANVQSRIKELAQQVAVRARDRFKVNADYVLARHKEIDEMDAADVIAADGTVMPIHLWPKVWRQYISGFEVAELSEGRGDNAKLIGALKKIKWPDKTKNLELLGKHVGVNAYREVREHTGPGGGPIQTVSLSAEQYAEIRRQMIERDDC